ncbi:NADH dehydrogenase [ubiquinone] 1 beta subcomplex subunit 7-like [Anticarsia gemmatalis]|uniref:NADH dehydrogenase [ubiquinone] 1 beta subcomplex subunit 7-like n=1 Tax=Anticarsia gemmatalis TaxID=129554 RepID=UPI003F769433
MGQMLGTWPTKEINLEMNDTPTFPPTKGFTFKRGERVMEACQEDLMSAKIPIQFRDYCAHYLLDYQICRYKYMPFVVRCAHEKHAYLECEHQDYLLRMKEFERERRLRERELRVQKKAKECK